MKCNVEGENNSRGKKKNGLKRDKTRDLVK